MNKIEQIKYGLEFSKHTLNTINVSGIDNIEKLVTVFHNIDTFLNMLKNNEVNLIETENIPKPNNSKEFKVNKE